MSDRIPDSDFSSVGETPKSSGSIIIGRQRPIKTVSRTNIEESNPDTDKIIVSSSSEVTETSQIERKSKPSALQPTSPSQPTSTPQATSQQEGNVCLNKHIPAILAFLRKAMKSSLFRGWEDLKKMSIITIILMLAYMVNMYFAAPNITMGETLINFTAILVFGSMITAHSAYVKELRVPGFLTDPRAIIFSIIWCMSFLNILTFFTIFSWCAFIVHARGKEIFKDFINKLPPNLMTIFVINVAIYVLLSVALIYHVYIHHKNFSRRFPPPPPPQYLTLG